MLPDDDQTRVRTPAASTSRRDGAAFDAESVIRLLRGATPSRFPEIAGYEIECELGRGGMGIVYKARHVPLNRVVALKMILTSEHANAGEIARFRAEAEAVAAIKHANVVQIYDLSPDGFASPYFAMEYVAGGSLAKFLKANGVLSPTAAVELLAPLADGLQAAHDAGLVHRDVKPANVLLSNAECGTRNAESEDKSDKSSSNSALCIPHSALMPKVSDFGLAKRFASDVTRTLAVAGTPAYMAPEQAGGKSKYVGPGADVYALGAVLYECLTGAPPFVGTDQWAIIEDVLHTAPVSPRVRTPGVSRDLELICLRCLEKDAHHRYPSAAALADDLRRFLAGKPVSVRPIGPVTRATRWAKRRPTAAALVGVVVAVCFAVPAAVVWGVGEADRHKTETAAAKDREDAILEEKRLADLAKIAADDATAAALRLAAMRDLFAIQNQLLRRAADRPLAWTYSNRADLPKAAMLAAGEPGAVSELRSTAAVTLLAADLKPLDPVVKGFTASAAATNPKTGQIAVGEYLTWVGFKSRVRLINPVTGLVERELTFPAGWAEGKPDSVRALAFSADGTRLFVGTRGSRVIRFDLDKPGNEPAKAWDASISPLEQLAVSPDGETVYGLCRPEKPVFAWRADTGKLVAKLEPLAEAPFVSFAVLMTGDVIACDTHQIRRWTPDLKPAQTVANGGARRLATTGVGTLLVGDGRNLDVYDPDALVPLDRFVTSGLRRGVHEEFVRTIVVHPSGAFAATSSGDVDRTIRVWELASSRLVGTVAATGTGPIALAWGGEGRTLYATASGHLARWEFRASVVQLFACHSGSQVAAASFVSGDRLATLTDRLDSHRKLLVGTASGAVLSARVPDRGGNGRPGVAASPDGVFAVSTDSPGVVARQLGATKGSVRVPPTAFVNDIVWCPQFSPDGGTLWAIVSSANVVAFDVDTQKPRATWSNAAEGATRGVASLDALAVGRTVVVAGARSGSVHLLDAPTGKFAASFSTYGDPVLSVALSPDEAFAVAGTQAGKLRLIRLGDREELSPVELAHSGGVTAVSINRDGSLLATGGVDRVVRLWKRVGDQFEPVLAVSDLSGSVRELQFGADDRLLVLVAHERAVRVWDVERLRTQLGRFKLAW